MYLIKCITKVITKCKVEKQGKFKQQCLSKSNTVQKDGF